MDHVTCFGWSSEHRPCPKRILFVGESEREVSQLKRSPQAGLSPLPPERHWAELEPVAVSSSSSLRPGGARPIVRTDVPHVPSCPIFGQELDRR